MTQELTETERLVLECLRRSPGIVSPVSLYQYSRMTGQAFEVESSIRAHVRNIRKKLGYEVIKTHHGKGYSTGTGKFCPTCLQAVVT